MVLYNLWPRKKGNEND